MPAGGASTVLLSSAQPDEPLETCRISGGPMIQRRLAPLIDADEINILCVNCIYPSVVHALQPLFADKGRNIRMHHYIQPDVGRFECRRICGLHVAHSV